MQGGERRSIATRAHAVLSYTAAVVLLAGVAADTAGLALHRTSLWAAGSHLVTAGIALAIIAALAGAFALSRRRGIAIHSAAALLAILLLALARWVRGHPEVQPDPPIFAAEIVAAVIVLMLLRGGRSLSESGR